MTHGSRNSLLWLAALICVGGYVGFRMAAGGDGGLSFESTKIEAKEHALSEALRAGEGKGVQPMSVSPAKESAILRRPADRDRPSVALDAIAARPEEKVVSGRVSNEAGDPVAGATVEVRLMEATENAPLGAVLRSTVSDQDGNYLVRDFIRLGERYRIEVRHPDYATLRTPVVDPLVPGTLRRDVVLLAGAVLSGRVVSGVAGPVAGAKVAVLDLEARFMSRDGVVERTATTDSDGRYEVPHLANGSKRVVVELADMTRGERSPVILRGDRPGVDFTLHPGRGIGGIVRDESGNPVSGISVRVSPVGSPQQPRRLRGQMRVEMAAARGGVGGVAVTGADGRFQVDGLAPGIHVVAIEPARRDSGSIKNATVGEQDVVLTIKRRAQVAGVVIDAGTGEPVPRFSVSLVLGRTAIRAASSTRKRIDAPDGRFLLEDVASGFHCIVVEAPGYSRGVVGPIQIGREERIAGVELRLERGAVVSGHILDSSGEGVGAALVSLIEEVELPTSQVSGSGRRQATVPRGRVRTFVDGSYAIPNVNPGRFHLKIAHDLYATAVTPSFEVALGETLHVEPDVILPVSATVTGVVLDENGHPDFLAVVSAYPERGSVERSVKPAATDGSGRFILSGLRAGRWKLVVTQRKGRTRMTARTASDAVVIGLGEGEQRHVVLKDQ